ncbi:MAG: divalent-cation tolerance protein CutA [Gemmatimonadota bacterium]|nr:divalent-cation tolerance protein CutA [Gemmatimonadota bacterium]
MTDLLVVTTAVPDEALAARIAAATVQARLAACAQVQGPVRSTYHWHGAMEQATEWYCHCKTTRARYPELERLIRSLHPYEVPEILALPIVVGHRAYLDWIGDTLAADR